MKRTPLSRRTPLRTGARLARSAPVGNQRSSAPLQRTSPMSPLSGLKRTKGLRTNRKPPMTEAESRRCDQMKAIGCTACLQNSRMGWRRAPVHLGNPLEIHHLLSGGRRRGHADTVCLCRYHHQGDWLPLREGGYKVQSEQFGPSFGRQPGSFRTCYGAEDALLALQDQLLIAHGHQV